MLFNSYTFIIFFTLVLILYNLNFSWNIRKSILLLASYLFYAAWNPPFVFLLLFTTFSDWILSQQINKAENKSKRKLLLIISLTMSLGLLSYFKYGGFFLENFVVIVNSFGIDYHPLKPDIILPVGISFYTFHTLSYVIDIYFKKYKPWHSFLDYSLYVAFFPQLVAGPILRAPDFLPQCTTPKKSTPKNLNMGLTLLIIGLFEKVVLADGLFAPSAESLFASNIKPGFIDGWIGTLAFAGQIFTDFAGYSTCAIGTALCLGFEVKKNFLFPYAAIGFSDFWKRWHISLSSFLRDYLYIQLGGNKKGNIRTYINLMLTMLLGGLWHGASWTFVVWGGLHGLYLILERLANKIIPKVEIWDKLIGKIFLAIITFILVNFAWVFFRATTFEHAFSILQSMLLLNGSAQTMIFDNSKVAMISILTLFMLIVHWFMRNRTIEQVYEYLPWWGRSVAIATMLILIVILSGDDRAFIYFQF
jgi:alginate O-acetyltransferase complex protein AlgI